MRPIGLLAALLTVLAVAACSGGSASPSASTAATMSTAPSEPSSMAPSADPSASARASASAGVGAPVEVVGTDYAFSGLAATYSGPITITFRNDGSEVHEIVVVRKGDGVTQSWEELLALPEDQSGALVSFAGVAFAEPGQTSPDTVTATEPGEYLAICFIPQGTMDLPSLDPAASGPPDLGTGAPHFTLGMQAAFSITQ